MARLNISIPDALQERIRSELPDTNVSAIFREAITALLDECPHDTWACARCGHVIDRARAELAGADAFARELYVELERLVDQGATAQGAAMAMRSLARDHGLATGEFAVIRPPRERTTPDSPTLKETPNGYVLTR